MKPPTTTVQAVASLGNLTLPITSSILIRSRHRCWQETDPSPCQPPRSPHLLGGGFACNGAVQVDGERGDGVHHQGQQDHEQDIGVSQGIPAGICQREKLVGDV